MPAHDLAIPLVDEELPGLARVLDPVQLAAWLSDTGDREVRVLPRRLRYKPGISLVMSIGVDAAGCARSRGGEVADAMVRVYSRGAATKARKALVQTPPGAVLAHDQSLGVLVTTAGGDRDLPLLGRLHRTDGLADVVGRVLPGRPELGRGTLRTLRHNPARRWVGVVEVDDKPAVVLRGYPRHEVRARARGYDRLAGGAPPTPALLGRSVSRSVVAVEWVCGTELDASPEHGCWLAGVATLAKLHAREHVHLARRHRDRDVEQLWEAADQVAGLLPDLSATVRRLADDCAVRLVRAARDRTPVHGDFSPDQVVVMPDGGTALVDLDNAHAGSAAADLGCGVAATLIAAEENDTSDRGREQAEALVEGYASARRPPDDASIGAYALAFRLRKAAEPFRMCAPDWPARVTARVHHAETARALLFGEGPG